VTHFASPGVPLDAPDDDDKRLQALERIRNKPENKYSQGKLTVQRTGDCCDS